MVYPPRWWWWWWYHYAYHWPTAREIRYRLGNDHWDINDYESPLLARVSLRCWLSNDESALQVDAAIGLTSNNTIIITVLHHAHTHTNTYIIDVNKECLYINDIYTHTHTHSHAHWHIHILAHIRARTLTHTTAYSHI